MADLKIMQESLLPQQQTRNTRNTRHSSRSGRSDRSSRIRPTLHMRTAYMLQYVIYSGHYLTLKTCNCKHDFNFLKGSKFV